MICLRAGGSYPSGPKAGGSYGGVFAVNVATGPIAMDVPLDPHAITGLVCPEDRFEDACRSR